MDLNQPIGQKHLKSYFRKTIPNGRVPHAQLFVGEMGSGILPMAIAYASELLCSNYEIDSAERGPQVADDAPAFCDRSAGALCGHNTARKSHSARSTNSQRREIH